jgi:hypothetical protein
MVSGESLRQSARTKGLSRGTVEERRDRVGLHCLRLWRNLERVADRKAEEKDGKLGKEGKEEREGRWFLDEMETFEWNRRMKPLTVALLVEGESGWIGGFGVGRLRSRAGASLRSQEARALFEKARGKRRNESRRIVRGVLRRIRHSKPEALVSDRKGIYGPLVREILGVEVRHVRVGGRPKGVGSPLFPVNHAAAMARYGMSRLIRRTMCTTKERRRLKLHGAAWAVWKNCWRRRRNRRPGTAAMWRGIVPRRLEMGELFGWRQDWGENSIPVWEKG